MLLQSHFHAQRKMLKIRENYESPEEIPQLLSCCIVWLQCMNCVPVLLPFVYKVIRTSSVLAALKHLQMMRNSTLKYPNPPNMHDCWESVHVCVCAGVGVSHWGLEIVLH